MPYMNCFGKAMKIIILEDDHDLRATTEKYLTLKGFTVEAYANGNDLLDRDEWRDVGCILLDIDVPGCSGYEVIKILKQCDISVPVIFVSGRQECSDMARAFDYGGVDYMKKPFELAELELRIRLHTKAKETAKTAPIALCDDYTYDPDRRHLLKKGEYVPLPSTIARLLHSLVTHMGGLVSFDMLETEVWEGRSVTRTTVSSHLKELRDLLPCADIKNVRGEGYVFQKVSNPT